MIILTTTITIIVAIITILILKITIATIILIIMTITRNSFIMIKRNDTENGTNITFKIKIMKNNSIIEFMETSTINNKSHNNTK